MLKKRHKTYHVRAFVPADLRETVRRSEVARSLRTVNFSEAVNLGALWRGRMARLWQLLRTSGHRMTRHQIEALVQAYLDARLDEAEERIVAPQNEAQIDRFGVDVNRDVWADELTAQLERVNAALQFGRFETVEPLAAEMLPTAEETARRVLCRRLLEAQQESLVAELRAMSGQPLPARRFPDVPPHPPAKLSPEPSPLLSEVIADYDRQVVSGWKPRSAQMAREGLAFFLSIVQDKPIGSLTAAELREYRVALKARPGRRGAHLSPGSIAKHQSYVTGVFKWAHDGELIDSNPAPKVLKPEKDTELAEEKRDAFSREELRVIFGGDYSDLEADEPARYWLPLLMLHTGARNEEIAQLYCADVKAVEGFHCIDINEATGDKSTKNKYSRRLTPLHPHLEDLGFLRYVESVRQAGQERLFPALTRTARGYNAPVSRWFNRRLERLGVKTPKKDSYSLRHTFSTRLKEAGVATYIIDQLTGHKSEGESAGRYGKKVPIRVLMDSVRPLNLL